MFLLFLKNNFVVFSKKIRNSVFLFQHVVYLRVVLSVYNVCITEVI